MGRLGGDPQKLEILDRLQEGGRVGTSLTPALWAGGGRGGRVGSSPTKPDPFPGGESGEGLCRLPETPAEFMVDVVIFVDYVC